MVISRRREFFRKALLAGAASLVGARANAQSVFAGPTPLVAGRPGAWNVQTSYYISDGLIPGANTTAVSANFLYYQPISVSGLMTKIGIEVTTGAAGLCRLGLYTNNNGYPDRLILDAGTVDTTSIALVEATISQQLTGEWVWMAAVFNATPTVRGCALGPSVLGGNLPSSGVRALIAPYTFGALPATAVATTNYTANAAAVWLRA